MDMLNENSNYKVECSCGCKLTKLEIQPIDFIEACKRLKTDPYMEFTDPYMEFGITCTDCLTTDIIKVNLTRHFPCSVFNMIGETHPPTKVKIVKPPVICYRDDNVRTFTFLEDVKLNKDIPVEVLIINKKV
jgi:hypothetical protein